MLPSRVGAFLLALWLWPIWVSMYIYTYIVSSPIWVSICESKFFIVVIISSNVLSTPNPLVYLVVHSRTMRVCSLFYYFYFLLHRLCYLGLSLNSHMFSEVQVCCWNLLVKFFITVFLNFRIPFPASLLPPCFSSSSLHLFFPIFPFPSFTMSFLLGI